MTRKVAENSDGAAERITGVAGLSAALLVFVLVCGENAGAAGRVVGARECACQV